MFDFMLWSTCVVLVFAILAVGADFDPCERAGWRGWLWERWNGLSDRMGDYFEDAAMGEARREAFVAWADYPLQGDVRWVLYRARRKFDVLAEGLIWRAWVLLVRKPHDRAAARGCACAKAL